MKVGDAVPGVDGDTIIIAEDTAGRVADADVGRTGMEQRVMPQIRGCSDLSRPGSRGELWRAHSDAARGAAKLVGYLVSLTVSLVSTRAAAMDRCRAADLSGLRKKVYVKPDGADSDVCGTTAGNACKTIRQGILNCFGSACGVLVQHGKYELTATLELRSGVDVYGGCELGVDGAAPATPYRSVILAPPDGEPAISATSITKRTVLHGFSVLGSDATTPSAPSIGMLIKDSSLVLHYNLIVGGKGAPGANGQTPGRPPTAGRGNPGWAGKCGWGCPYPASGGSSASGQNDGGVGGAMYLHWNGSTCDWKDQEANGGAGQGVAGGEGGKHGDAGRQCLGHYHVSDGAEGSPPQAAAACGSQPGARSMDPWGSVDARSGTWAPSRAGNGGPGGDGSGGGGGGAGGSCINWWETHWMAGGGGGGGGGTGGTGGQGGQQGGASFPLLLIRSTVEGLGNRIVPGSGGAGGAGGAGGLGGWGGAGGDGGKGRFDTVDDYQCPGNGGKGGGGRQGGAAAGGAGGNGGPSVGIAYVGGQPPASIGKVYGSRPGAKGKGGPGGSEGCTGATGEDGTKGAEGLSRGY